VTDIDAAFAAAEEIEFVARIYYQTQSVGTPVILPDEEMDTVLEKFKTYGQKKNEVGLMAAGNRLVCMLRVGRLLILTALMGGAVLVHCLETILLLAGEWTLTGLVIPVSSGLTGGTVSIIALLDARSRLQEYKRAKDLFFENGFKSRIADLFIHSKCQRQAVGEAARELGLATELCRYYREKGYCWYHILPDFTFKRPDLFFTRRYWQKTLFVPYYQSRHFL